MHELVKNEDIETDVALPVVKNTKYSKDSIYNCTNYESQINLNHTNPTLKEVDIEEVSSFELLSKENLKITYLWHDRCFSPTKEY